MKGDLETQNESRGGEPENGEPRYRELVESLPLPVWTCFVGGAVEHANQRFLAYTGRTLDELSREGWSASVHPDDRQAATGGFSEALAGEHELEMELRLQKHDGQYRWFRVSVAPLRKENGSVTRWLASCTDVDEARELRETLRFERERLEKIAAAAPQVLHSIRRNFDGALTFSYLGAAFERIFGLSGEAVAADATKFIDLYHPEDVPGLVQTVIESERTMSPWRYEWRINVPGREPLWIEGHSMPVKEPDGSLTWHGVLSDVTDRKLREERLLQSELELSRSNDRFLEIANSLNHVFWVLELAPEPHVAYVSPAFERIWGRKAEELYANPRLWIECIHEEDRPPVAEALERWMENPVLAKVIDAEYRVTGSDGKTRWIRDTGQAQADRSGRVVRASGIAEDITAQKLAEQALRREREELEDRVVQRTAELEAANRELEAFSYSVSHDLRAPLRIVNGFADALSEDFGHALPPEALRYVGNLREGGRRMSELIADLLAFSQLGRHPIERAPVDVEAIVQECLNELTQATRGREALVSVGELAPCSGDAALLKQVFFNLLGNAFKYSRNRDPARIEVGCRKEAGEIIYFVRDNGTGFDMGYAHRLFQVFQRLHREQEFEGTGVGLAIVKRIVSSHGGRVWAEAAPDRGATFSLTLEPAAD